MQSSHGRREATLNKSKYIPYPPGNHWLWASLPTSELKPPAQLVLPIFPPRPMEKPGPRWKTWAMCSVVLLLGLVAFSCCVAAEFNKAKEKDMKLDGNLCSMPRTAAFGLGVTALVCLSVAQILATSAAIVIRLRSKGKKQSTSAPKRRPDAAMTVLCLSWVSFGMATILLSTGSSMSKGQPYGRGWADGKCYVVRTGVVYLGSAALVVLTAVALIVSMRFTSAAGWGGPAAHPRWPEPDELRVAN